MGREIGSGWNAHQRQDANFQSCLRVEPIFNGETAEEIEGSKQPMTGTEGFSENVQNPKKRQRTTSNEMESSNKRK
jgi:hypothetical protein